jgi:hypothetical protein
LLHKLKLKQVKKDFQEKHGNLAPKTRDFGIATSENSF